MKKFLLKISFISLQFGFDITRPFKFFKSLPKYLNDYFKFKKNFNGSIEFLPCLHDWYEEGGNTKGEYFLQDLTVARIIAKKNPVKHIDIGSSIEGFVAHVASFRQIEVLDVRPITSEIPGIIFKQLDLSLPIDKAYQECYDSVSCLHALEHFGLGRYGDPIDVNGHEKGLRNISDLLNKDGVLYLSVPIGKERVEFNANRVFDPKNILEISIKCSLNLESFILIENSTVQEINLDFETLNRLGTQRYALGIFIFNKL
jgi:hypothetical protein